MKIVGGRELLPLNAEIQKMEIQLADSIEGK
jgi:hypothetical protein